MALGFFSKSEPGRAIPLSGSVRHAIRGMNAVELHAVYDALWNASEVFQGSCNQPRCNTAGTLNAAGELSSQLHNEILDVLEAVVDEARAMKPETPEHRDMRAFLLLKDAIHCRDDLPMIASFAASLAVPDRH